MYYSSISICRKRREVITSNEPWSGKVINLSRLDCSRFAARALRSAGDGVCSNWICDLVDSEPSSWNYSGILLYSGTVGSRRELGAGKEQTPENNLM